MALYNTLISYDENNIRSCMNGKALALLHNEASGSLNVIDHENKCMILMTSKIRTVSSDDNTITISTESGSLYTFEKINDRGYAPGTRKVFKCKDGNTGKHKYIAGLFF